MPSAISPEEFDPWFDQAYALQQEGNLDAAQEMYENLLLLNPDHAGVMINLAAVHFAWGNIQESIRLLEQAIAIAPNEAYAHCAYANALTRLLRFDEARASYDRAIDLSPEVAMFYTSRGVLAYQTGRFADALADHDQAIALNADYADAYNNRGNVFASLKQQDAALESYAHACALQPGNAVYWNNRGAMLHFFRRDNEALACYDHAMVLQPYYVDSYVNRGTLLGDMRRFEEALASFDQAIALQPDAVEAWWNKALVLLLTGDYLLGWALYEWRWKKPAFRNEIRKLPQPLWLGETDIQGKTLLIHPEQGFGDYIQFCRYARLLQDQGVRVIFEAPPSLVPLLRTLGEDITIVAKGDPLPPFDVHIPLMSLPHALGTTVDTIPSSESYLQADEAKHAAWDEKLGTGQGRRIGLAWSGSPTHVNDHNRSMRLHELATLFDGRDRYYALQKDIRSEDRDALHHLGVHLEESHDFADTAALVGAMDLIICVDTVTAHLAGALGKPVWLLVPYVPDFRWLLDRSDSPWYPSMRLFRQSKPGDWTQVMAEVKAALHENDAPAPVEISAQTATATVPMTGVSQAMLDKTFQFAVAAQQAGDLEKAEKLYTLLLAADPRHLNATANLSTLHLARGNYEQAVLMIDEALKLDPNQAALHYNYGKILMHVKLYGEALRRYERAISLQPETAAFHSGRGIALYELARYEEAIESYGHAIVRDPNTAEYYNNRGNALGHAARFDEAITDYGRAAELLPSLADAHWNRAILQIMHGDFASGLKGYEWRWKRANFRGDLRHYKEPLWLGDAPLGGKTILIYPEQGLGDVIQFSRYIPLLEERGATVIFEVPAPLVAFMRTVSPTVQVIAKGTTPLAFDYQCPIMSLPLAFTTEVNSIPNRVPYLAVPEEKRVLWDEKLGLKMMPRVGLTWSGSATHANDHNRSVALAAFAPIFALPFEFHSLQKEVRAEDEAAMARVIDHREELNDFTDTAALIEAMDLVISVDTSVAHVAGALGKKLWLMLPLIPDYRWLLDRADTPWYPQARLFRQKTANDWAEVMAQLRVALTDFTP